MPDQQDPAVEAYEEIRKCIHSTEPSVTGMELDITEIIRKAYAPLLAAKDKRIAELESEAECELCEARLDANMPGVCLDCHNGVRFEMLAKDKRIAELEAGLNIVRAEFCDNCDYQPCFVNCDGKAKLAELLAEEAERSNLKMTKMLNELSNSSLKEIYKAKDELIKKHAQMSDEEIKKRGSIEVWQNQFEVFKIDGKPILMFSPIKIETKKENKKLQFILSFKWGSPIRPDNEIQE